MMELKQEGKTKIIQSKRTVDWLINNTQVRTFDPITFNGYQRQIDEKHAQKIVDYILKRDFYFPTAIICSVEHYEEGENIETLNVVDGQHRVHAFKMLKKQDIERYNAIKNFEIPVIILVNPKLAVEIETFITINKTSKTVDTSLAYVLKNKINKGNTEAISNTARREYLAVEVARWLNTNVDCAIWNDKILYEGSIRNRFEYITLNGFVRSMRALLGTLDKKHIVLCDWTSDITKEQLEQKVKDIANFVEFVWKTVYKKWPDLQTDNHEDSRVIQGTIGFTTINRYLIKRTPEFDGTDMNEYKKFVERIILNDIDVPSERWKKGGIYSKFTSESGYKAIVDDLLGNGIG